MKQHIAESHLVDLADDALKELLGATYHGLKNIEEASRSDPEIAALQEQLKELRRERYTERISALRARLKAARALAAARGVTWNPPELA